MTRSNIPALRVPNATFTVTRKDLPVPADLVALGLRETVVDSLSRRMWSHSAETVNHFLLKEHKRLVQLAAHHPVLFWKRATFLITNSDAYLLAALCHVRPKWYEGDSFRRVIDWLWSAQRARKSWKATRGLKSFHPIIATIELDKPDGGKREISSPKIQARLLIFLWNHFLSLYLDPRLPANFHGHRKGMGTHTAWEMILTSMDEMDNIWEFDLHKFHDSISQGLILESLLQAGIPIRVARNLIDLCRAQTVLNDAEVRARRLLEHPDKDPSGRTPWDSGPKTGFSKYMQTRGSPQGVSTSALLATWTLHHLGVASNPDYLFISYADDGMIMSKASDPDEWFVRTLNTDKSGIRVNTDKCHWVKWCGQWQKDLKFLGLRLCHEEGRVYASSRSGRNKGLFFKVGDQWLDWMSKVNLKDLQTDENSPNRISHISRDEERKLSPDRLRNLPVAIARLFWPAEMYEAFADKAPPWPDYHKDALKVLFRGLYGPYWTMDEGSSFYWDILLHGFRVLTANRGEQAYEPHTKYYPRNTKLWAGADWAKELGLFYLFIVEKDGNTHMTYGALNNPEDQEYLKEARRASRIGWPLIDYYKRHWVNYRTTPFRFRGSNRDKWATVGKAT